MLIWATKTVYKLVCGEKAKIFPRIMHIDYLSRTGDIPETIRENRPITEALVDDMVLTYGIARGGQVESLSESSLTKMKQSITSMREFAYTNMQFKLQDLKLDQNDKLTRLFLDGGLSASAFLMPEFWEEFERNAHFKVAVAIPHRDYLFFADSGDSEAMRQLKGAARECVLPDNQSLTTAIFIRNSNTIKVGRKYSFETFPHGMSGWQKIE